MAHILAIIGSGETSPSMVSIHQELAGALKAHAAAVILETPYGFQENVDAVSEKTKRYFAGSVGLHVTVAPGLRAPAAAGPEVDHGIAVLREADWVFAGPGSPSYAARHWRDSPVGQALRDRLGREGVTIFASAAACAAGRFTLPVYEIYKVGMEPHWVDGIDLLAALGIVAAAIPHFDNADGGTHDTRYCYVGERRLLELQEQLPAEAVIVGVDEHTAAVFDLGMERVRVLGRGGLTMRSHKGASVLPNGSTLRLNELRNMVGGAIPAIPLTVANEPAGSGALTQMPEPGTASVLVTARVCETRFDQALASRDSDAMVAAILDLEAAIAAWSTDTLESDLIDGARAVLRSLVVRLGAAVVAGLRDPHAQMAAIVVPLLALRAELRRKKHFEIADAIRGALAQAGIEVEDRPEGSRWHGPE